MTTASDVVALLLCILGSSVLGALLQRLRMFKRMKECERTLLDAQMEANAQKRNANAWHVAHDAARQKIMGLEEYTQMLEEELDKTEGELAASKYCLIRWPERIYFEQN